MLADWCGLLQREATLLAVAECAAIVHGTHARHGEGLFLAIYQERLCTGSARLRPQQIPRAGGRLFGLDHVKTQLDTNELFSDFQKRTC